MAIKTHSPDKPVLIFVSSRRQTRLTAQDLVNYLGMEENPKRFLRMEDDILEARLETVRDQTLRQTLSFGIGLHHAGLTETDRKLVEELFVTNMIQVLIATSTLAWGVNFPAHLVIVKATEYFDAKLNSYKDMDLTDVLQMMGITSNGVANVRSCRSTRVRYQWRCQNIHLRRKEVIL
jgi:antiviral helicase SLH1